MSNLTKGLERWRWSSLLKVVVVVVDGRVEDEKILDIFLNFHCVSEVGPGTVSPCNLREK